MNNISLKYNLFSKKSLNYENTYPKQCPTSFGELLNQPRSQSLRPQIQYLIQNNSALKPTNTQQSKHKDPVYEFTPKLDRNSRDIVTLKRENREPVMVFDRLYGHAVVQNQTRQKYDKIRAEQLEGRPLSSRQRTTKANPNYHTPHKDPSTHQAISSDKVHRQQQQQSHHQQDPFDDKQVYEVWRQSLITLFKMLDTNKDGLIRKSEMRLISFNRIIQDILSITARDMSDGEYNFDDFFELLTMACVNLDLTIALMDGLSQQMQTNNRQ